MKKIGLLVVAASLSLSLAAFAGESSASNQGKSPSSQTGGAKGKAKARAQGRADPAARQKALNERLAALQREHQAATAELQAIKRLAVKERAPETAAALDKLIARHEQEYRKRIAPLQRQLKRLKAAQKGGADKAAKKGKGKPKTSN